MKSSLPLLIYVLLSACSSPSGPGREERATDTTRTAAAPPAKRPSIPTTPMNRSLLDRSRVASQCGKRPTEFTVPGPRTVLKPIPEVFLEKYIFNLPVSNIPAFSIPKDIHGQFYFNEYWESPDLFVFSIVYADESCCHSVYAITVDKKNNRIISAGLLGLSGGDGGWVEDDYGQWINDSTLRVVKPESYSGTDDGTTTIDTTWLEIGYTRAGLFRQSKLDSVHYEQKDNE